MGEIGSKRLKVAALSFMTVTDSRMRAVQKTPAFDTLDVELVKEVYEVLLNPMHSRKRPREGEDKIDFPVGSDWERLSNAQLRHACCERDLSTCGNREDLISLLQAQGQASDVGSK